jgi:Methyltransferase domain
MQTNPTHPIQRGVDREELDRQIAEMYRDVANEAERDLHFPTGRPLADELGYPAQLLDRLPTEAVRSFAGVRYHLGVARVLPSERVLICAAARGWTSSRLQSKVGPRGRVIGVDITPEQLANAQRLVRDEHVSFRRARIEALPFAVAQVPICGRPLRRCSSACGLGRRSHVARGRTNAQPRRVAQDQFRASPSSVWHTTAAPAAARAAAAARPPPSRTEAKAVRPAGAGLAVLAFRIYG